LVVVGVIVVAAITRQRWVGPVLGRLGPTTPDGGSLGLSLGSEATIERITDTGMTVSTGSAGANGRICRLTLQVAPLGGLGSTYTVEVSQAIPRHVIPNIQPGMRIPVAIDTKDRTLVVPDLSQFLEPSEKAAEAGTATAGASADRFFPVSGTQALRAPAPELLTTGTAGVATIKGAMPLMGKTLGEAFTGVDPSRMNNPLYLFTADVTVADEPPFAAKFGCDVPPEKVGAVKHGARLAVAVNMENRSQEIAVDWDRSPLAE
jgi:hypothetical protein